MVKFVDSELEQLRREIDQMWTLVYKQIDQARNAVMHLDKDIARQIVIREHRVDAFELKIDSDVEDFIALYTPVAVDLRFVLAMLKINGDLERVADYAEGMARYIIDCKVDTPDNSLLESLQLSKMFDTVLEMFSEIQKAFREEDANIATAVLAMDDGLDNMKRASGAILSSYAEKNSTAIPFCLGLGDVVNRLERAGDHITNIAEQIVFYLDAKVLKHGGQH